MSSRSASCDTGYIIRGILVQLLLRCLFIISPIGTASDISYSAIFMIVPEPPRLLTNLMENTSLLKISDHVPCLIATLYMRSYLRVMIHDNNAGLNQTMTGATIKLSSFLFPSTVILMPVPAGTHPSPNSASSPTLAAKPEQCMGRMYVGAGRRLRERKSTVGLMRGASSGPARWRPPMTCKEHR